MRIVCALSNINPYKISINAIDNMETWKSMCQIMDSDHRSSMESEKSEETYVTSGAMSYEKASTLIPGKTYDFPRDCFQLGTLIYVKSSWAHFPDLSLYLPEMTATKELTIEMHRDILRVAMGTTRFVPTKSLLYRIKEELHTLAKQRTTSDLSLTSNSTYATYILVATGIVHWFLMQNSLTDQLSFMAFIQEISLICMDLNAITDQELLYIDTYMFFLYRMMANNLTQDIRFRNECLHYLRRCIEHFMNVRVFNNYLFSYSTMVDILTKSPMYPYMHHLLDSSSCNTLSEHLHTNMQQTLLCPVTSAVVQSLKIFDAAYINSAHCKSYALEHIFSARFEGMPDMYSLQAEYQEGFM